MVLLAPHALPGRGSAHWEPQLWVSGMTAEPPESQGEGSVILFVLQLVSSVEMEAGSATTLSCVSQS